MTRRLRPIAGADLAALAALHRACFPHDRWDAKALAELLGMAGASGHLVEEPGPASPPVGLLLDTILVEEGEILTLGVAPAARRQGIARLLLDDLFARARARGARRLSLEVAADNAAATRLYESCGFALAGRRRGYYRRPGGPVDALVYRRILHY